MIRYLMLGLFMSAFMGLLAQEEEMDHEPHKKVVLTPYIKQVEFFPPDKYIELIKSLNNVIGKDGGVVQKSVSPYMLLVDHKLKVRTSVSGKEDSTEVTLMFYVIDVFEDLTLGKSSMKCTVQGSDELMAAFNAYSMIDPKSEELQNMLFNARQEAYGQIMANCMMRLEVINRSINDNMKPQAIAALQQLLSLETECTDQIFELRIEAVRMQLQRELQEQIDQFQYFVEEKEPVESVEEVLQKIAVSQDGAEVLKDYLSANSTSPYNEVVSKALELPIREYSEEELTDLAKKHVTYDEGELIEFFMQLAQSEQWINDLN